MKDMTKRSEMIASGLVVLGLKEVLSGYEPLRCQRSSRHLTSSKTEDDG